MSDWRIQQRYGYGAGLVPLGPELVSRRQPEPTLSAGLKALADEFHGQGISGNVRFVIRAVPALVFVLTLLFALFTTINREKIDQSTIEIVKFEPEILPEPEVVEPEPIPEPEPVQVAEVEPPPPAPPAPKLPPPPPKRAPEPPPAPKPPPKRVEPPKPPPRPVQVVRKAPPPVVRIDPVPVRPERKPPVLARVERADPKPVMPKIAPPPPIAMDPVPPENPVMAAAPRAPARSAPRSMKPPPRMAPPALSPVTLDLPERSPAKPLPSRAARRAPDAAPRKPAVAPNPVSFDLRPPSEAAASQAPTPPTRSARAAPVAASSARRAMPSALTPAPGLSGGPAQANPQAEPGSNRTDRVAPSVRAGRNRIDDRLEGVALSSLAACRTDREEEKLKIQVMAALASRKDCSSDAGRYRFIETKNLNAFLMLIERAPSRSQADRCVELRLTLECLGAR